MIIKGRFPLSHSPEELISDMLEIDLPDGITLDVGWIPEHDISGSYRIVVFRDYWVNQTEKPIFTSSFDEMVKIVKERCLYIEESKKED